MATYYTFDQFVALKEIVKQTEDFLDGIHEKAKETGLDKVPGFRIRLEFDPKYNLIAKIVQIGTYGTGEGYVYLSKGIEENEYRASGAGNSSEYVYAFASDETKARMREILQKQTPVPSDSVWLRGDAYDSDVDCGVQVSGVVYTDTDS